MGMDKIAAYSQPDAEDYGQPDAPEFLGHPVNKAAKTKRTGSKGNRREQAARYWQRNRARRRGYFRDYMRARRRLLAADPS